MKLTYKEWRAKGYNVTRGSKSVGRNEKGEAVFSDHQVSNNRYCGMRGRPRRRSYDSYYDNPGDYDYEMDEDFAALHNYGWGND